MRDFLMQNLSGITEKINLEFNMEHILENKYYIDDYEFESYVSDAVYSYGLFQSEMDDSRIDQLRLLVALEKKFNLFKATSFGNLVHFQNSSKIPIQRWFPYREGYSIKLVDTFIKEFKITKNVFDPFCGSGTTLLSARLNNLQSYGIDINPISVLISRVENEVYDQNDIKIISDITSKITMIKRNSKYYKTNFELSAKVFNEEILQSLLQLKELIHQIDNVKIRNLFYLVWLAIIEDVSNIKKEGNGIKYKNRKRTSGGYINISKSVWENHNFPNDRFKYVKEKYLNHLNKIISDLKLNYGATSKPPKVFHGDAVFFEKYFNNQIQFTFFSPPYCNCFDYFEIHKVELWLGDFIKNKNELRKLRSMGFRSNTNMDLNKPIEYKNETLEKLIFLFDSRKLWHKMIPRVVRGYFDDMHSLLKKLYERTINDGLIGIVVGNSAYTGVIIPTDLIISDVAKDIGFKVKNIFVTRHLTTSSQQKKQLESLKEYLRESIIVLEK